MGRRCGPLQKWARAPKFGKVVKCGKGGIFGFVGSMLIGILIYMDRYEEMSCASAGPLLRRFRVHRRQDNRSGFAPDHHVICESWRVHVIVTLQRCIRKT